ncbi:MULTISPECIES: ABC transporter permease [Brucella/Ochrobactrum group]|jgi:ABC-type dipeptide/oligopeptide/nickel transport system permease component|uniref:Binding-protein-dependent transport systems inner membrane component n=1 Tax=Brucella anthropi (strain ATCC 49188 / DSM 6882 / CCUG 24695 / JCM 21032 / LMG 3331 / NBRC 15819 / NCTC 12168 / Alc 37) TaxID=439375 RepID=A6X1T0_BRUA4|nr:MULTISPECIES: ABC transporter permease [Brucella/Ochrobactrum group]ABS15184.1 binding-protein-dependent transport systems inner membrane component [Brucella anthropi ATCC 49188]KAB2746960.1 ABC transporter permease [Brucella anthropi]KAB2759608.1 ABC transporter permease [Brucella anthropi]KAB2777039.1 ABC transporter permease [Brucella anthropi]KIU67541.1 glutathione ABC transporter permease [Brucella anthropi]
MVSFLIKRMGFALFTLFSVLTLVFVIVRVLPGDPALVILGDQASPASIAALHHKLGLDQPIIVQYGSFMLGVLQGNLGTSMITGRSITAEIMNVLPYTMELTIASLILGVLLGVPAGVWAAVKRNKPADLLLRLVSLLGLSLPAFVAAIILLMIFAIQLRWFPVISSGGGDGLLDRLRQMALPTISLALIMMAYITRVTRSAMLEVLNQDFVRTAKAKGASHHAVVWRHALGNCTIPITTVVGLYLGILIGNSVLTEIVFSRPGLGKLILNALTQRDYTLLQGMIVIYTLMVVAVNMLTDLTYGFLDPRVQYK